MPLGTPVPKKKLATRARAPARGAAAHREAAAVCRVGSGAVGGAECCHGELITTYAAFDSLSHGHVYLIKDSPQSIRDGRAGTAEILAGSTPTGSCFEEELRLSGDPPSGEFGARSCVQASPTEAHIPARQPGPLGIRAVPLSSDSRRAISTRRCMTARFGNTRHGPFLVFPSLAVMHRRVESARRLSELGGTARMPRVPG